MMYLYGFSDPFLFLSFKQQKKERGGYRDKCTREQQKERCVPVLRCFGRRGSGGRFFGDYRLCLKLAIKPMTALPQWLLAYWINVSKPPAKVEVSKGPSRPSVITHRLRRRAGSRMHNPCPKTLELVAYGVFTAAVGYGGAGFGRIQTGHSVVFR